AHRLDHAGHLVAGHADEQAALEGGEVGAADAAGRDAHQHLAGAGLGHGQVHDLEPLRLDEADRPHINPISATMRSRAHWTSASVSTFTTAGPLLSYARRRAGRRSSRRVTCSPWAPRLWARRS